MMPSPPAAAPAPGPSPALRIDELALFVRRVTPDGVRMEIRTPGPLNASQLPVLPVFEGWAQTSGELVLRAAGVVEGPFAASLDLDGTTVGPSVAAQVSEGAGLVPFSIEIVVPLRALTPHQGRPFKLGLALQPGGRVVRLFKVQLVGLRAPGPAFSSLDLLESTDSVLFDAPERRLFDLQNPEEGFWVGTGKWRLRLFAEWLKTEGEPYNLDARPSLVLHRWQRAGDASDLIWEDVTRRAGGRRTYTELVFDSSHPSLQPVPPEGKDIPLDLIVDQPLSFGENLCVLSWHAALPLRVRDPRPHLKTFQRLSAVGIDFGTTATVAALYQRGFRSLLRLGNSRSGSSAENPTYLLVEDHEKLWSELQKAGPQQRFPNLLRVVKGSHAAYEAMAEVPSAVIDELKSLPERVISLDQSPQLRDRERQRDFLLDEARVRMLIRTYAYLLGRAINRPGQDVYLRYWLTHPAKFDERARKLLEEELRNGILLSIPQDIPASEVVVSMQASEPEAFAAEVCPELAAHPALEPLVSQFGELRFAVFDFGGGTLDIACGRYRPASEQEQLEYGSSTVIETLQVSGDDHLGGDYLTHELCWLTHQHDKHLPEMEEKDVPMMRPATVPPNNLANKPHLYKRSLAGRQNRVRFERELGLSQVKHGPDSEPHRTEELGAVRLDNQEVRLQSLKTDLAGLKARLHDHLRERIRDGAKLLKTMLSNTPWGGEGDWRQQGVVILLAGNSSRSAFVEQVLAEELGIPGLKVWKPTSSGPFEQVVLYEVPARNERGTSIVGVSPKTAVALGALNIANRIVHLVRRSQGFSYFLGDLRGFPPKFLALIPMGTPTANPDEFGPHFVDFGRWDAQMPLRICKEYAPGKMTAADPRIFFIPTGLPAGELGRLYICVVSPEEIALHLKRDGKDPLRVHLNLAKFMR
ncbi:MAG: hypothetical protein MUF64_10270 [Polyangiaceae bacterium]|nr:hypothetical protein [Polyangiaceae bacterium]